MIYSTGAAGSPSSLKSTIESLATANGWTLSGAGVLYKGTSFVELATSGSEYLTIKGCGSSDGTLNPMSRVCTIACSSGEWSSAVFYITINTNPDMIICVVKYDTNRIQVLMFGNIKKIHDSAYVGGDFAWATSTIYSMSIAAPYDPAHQWRDFCGLSIYGTSSEGISESTLALDGCFIGQNSTKGQPIPFHFRSPIETTSYPLPQQGFHAEIDGQIWDEDHKVTFTNATVTSLYRSPNLYNSQALLVPMNLQYAMTDSLYGYLGYIDHMRLIRIDNYELGDIITIGTDQWKVFPWLQKYSAKRNGFFGTYTAGNAEGARRSGTLGFAIRIN
jgi:hypothetical protein